MTDKVECKPVGFDFMEKKFDLQPPPFNPVGSETRDTKVILGLLELIKDKDARIQELTDKLFSYYGISTPSVSPSSTSDMKPVSPPQQRWDNIRQRLEKRYAKTVKELDPNIRFSTAADNALKELTENEGEE